jgi:hypothetical protein
MTMMYPMMMRTTTIVLRDRSIGRTFGRRPDDDLQYSQTYETRRSIGASSLAPFDHQRIFVSTIGISRRRRWQDILGIAIAIANVFDA